MKITDKPVVVILAAVVAAFVAGISTYAFFKSRVGEEVQSYIKLNPDKLPEGPTGPSGLSVPIGSIIAWHQNLQGVPTELPTGWVPCNGQVIGDSKSPLNGQMTPDLNGDGRFLRGGLHSGTNEAGAIESHAHQVTLTGGAHSHGTHDLAGYGTGGDTDGDPHGARPKKLTISGGDHTHSGATKDAGVEETRPINMSVVWIMRVR